MKKDAKFDAIVANLKKAKKAKKLIPNYDIAKTMSHWSNGYN